MISVIIPTLNNSETLAPCLAALIPAAVDGLIRQVIIADGGSTDATSAIAESAGAEIVSAPPPRADRLIAGAAAAKQPWLMFLTPDGVLAHDWEREVDAHLEALSANGAARPAAAVFRFAIDDRGAAPRAAELATRIGYRVLGRACSEQGLLISRTHYDQLGGFRAQSAVEDIDLIRRIGRRDLVRLRTPITIAVSRYQHGYGRVAARHATRMLRSLIPGT